MLPNILLTSAWDFVNRANPTSKLAVNALPTVQDAILGPASCSDMSGSLNTYRNLGRDKSTTNVVMLASEMFGTKLWGSERNQHIWPQPITCR